MQFERRRPPAVAIRGGTVVDQTGTRKADVLIVEGIITSVGAKLTSVPTGTVVLDATGCTVCPGLVDLHSHLREPGGERSETIESGSRAAALGGYTAVVAMPNTNPAVDSAAAVRHILKLGEAASCEVLPAGAITIGREGKMLAPMGEMAELGVKIFTDDGSGVQDSRLMRRAMEYSLALDVVLAQHCEEACLAAGGYMNEGEWSSRLGMPGQPSEAEEVMVMRDLALARLTGARVHMLHLSTARSVELVRRAKASGLSVTAEVAPHHFTLTDEAVSSYDTAFKVNPPLRSRADRDALKRALVEGVFDAIATDHAPHAPDTKDVPFSEAPPGMLGLETAFSLAFSELDLDIQSVLALMSWQPAAIAGIQTVHGGPVVSGARANLCVFDADKNWTLEASKLASLSRNTPYEGRKMTGKVRHTIYDGEPVVVDEEATR